MKYQVAAAVLVGLLAPSDAWSAPVQVTGRVVDKGGKAVAGAEVARFWNRKEHDEIKPYGSATAELKNLLAPIGMTYVVRDEAIVLTRTP